MQPPFVCGSVCAVHHRVDDNALGGVRRLVNETQVLSQPGVFCAVDVRFGSAQNKAYIGSLVS